MFVMRVRSAGLLALVVALTISAAPAHASTALDQSQESGGGIFPVRSSSIAAQMFTAGKSGVLKQVDVTLGSNGVTGRDIVVEIRAAVAGLPTSTVLATALVPNGDIPQQQSAYDVWWLSVPLPDSVSVAGSQYALVLSDPTSPPFGGAQVLWGHSLIDGAYLDGDAVYSYDGGLSWVPYPNPRDFQFRTYVDAMPSSREECKLGGWKNFGERFKNQGDCVSFVLTGK